MISSEDILEAKKTLTPAMERIRGSFECVGCDYVSDVDGNCPNDLLPLRKLGSSER